MKNTPPWSLYLKPVPAIGTTLKEHSGHILARLAQLLIIDPAQSTQPLPYTQDARRDSPSYYHLISTLSAPSALATHKESSIKHHIIDIMHSRSSK